MDINERTINSFVRILLLAKRLKIHPQRPELPARDRPGQRALRRGGEPRQLGLEIWNDRLVGDREPREQIRERLLPQQRGEVAAHHAQAVVERLVVWIDLEPGIVEPRKKLGQPRA